MASTNCTYRFGPFRLEPERRLLERAGARVDLSARGFDMLHVLIQNHDRVLSRAEIMSAVWPAQTVEEHNLTVQMSKLRQALGDDGNMIATVPGRGYRFVASLEVEGGPAAGAVDAPEAGAGPRRPRRRRLMAGAALSAAVLAAGGFVAWRTLAPPAPADSLAVLPFANLSGDPAQDYFSDGLSEELISTLARLKPLHVIGRISSFRFKGSHEDSATIGLKLGVVWLLDGSVRREGGMVRISAELADAKTGYERWSATYDRDEKDIFAVQSGIAQAVAEALKVRLFGGDIAALSLNGTSSPEAYDNYLRGKKLLNDGAGEAGYRDALAKYDAAIAIDPHYAAAYGGRAATLVTLANQFDPPERMRATYDMALASARQAVELAPDLAYTQKTLASTLVYADHDFAGARQVFARAEALGAGEFDVLQDYGVFECQTGDCNSGAAALKRAVALDPLNPAVYRSLGIVLVAARRYPEAIAALREGLALSPRMAIAHDFLGDALMLSGNLEEAKIEYGLEPVAWARLPGQAMVLRRLGDETGAHAALAALISDDGDGSAYQEAQIYAQWGDRDRAFKALDTALQLNDAGPLMLKVDPWLAPLHADPRFAARLARMGLHE